MLLKVVFLVVCFGATNRLIDGKNNDDVFVTVTTPGSNGESVMDNVYLKPGFTAFETAEKFCREKDLDKVYSENGGMNPLHDNKCVLPITYELQKRSRSLCYKNPDHVLSLLIDVTNEEDITRSVELRYCEGQTAFDASVSFCREYITNDVMIGDCQAQIETILLTKLDRLLYDDAIITVASGTSSKVHIDTIDVEEQSSTNPLPSTLKAKSASTIQHTDPASTPSSHLDSISDSIPKRANEWTIVMICMVISVVVFFGFYFSHSTEYKTISSDELLVDQSKPLTSSTSPSNRMSKLHRSKLVASPPRQFTSPDIDTGGSSPNMPNKEEKGGKKSLTPSKKTGNKQRSKKSIIKSDIKSDASSSIEVLTNSHQVVSDVECRDPFVEVQRDLPQVETLPQMSPSRVLKDILSTEKNHALIVDQSIEPHNEIGDSLDMPPVIHRVLNNLPQGTNTAMMSVCEVEASLNSKHTPFEPYLKEVVELALKEERVKFEEEKKVMLDRLKKAEEACLLAEEKYTQEKILAANDANCDIMSLNKKLEICELELKAAMTTIAQTQSDARSQDHISYQLVQSLQKRAEVAERDLAILQERVGDPNDPVSHELPYNVSPFSHVSRRIGSAASSVTSGDEDTSSVGVSCSNIVISAASSVSGDDEHHYSPTMSQSPSPEPDSNTLSSKTLPTSDNDGHDVLVTQKVVNGGTGEKKKKLSQRARKARRLQYQKYMLQQQKEEIVVEEEEEEESGDYDMLKVAASEQQVENSKDQVLGSSLNNELLDREESNEKKGKMKWGDSYDEEDNTYNDTEDTSLSKAICNDPPSLSHDQYRPSTPIAMAVDDVQIAQMLDTKNSLPAEIELNGSDGAVESEADETHLVNRGNDGMSSSSDSPYSNNESTHQYCGEDVKMVEHELDDVESEDDYDGSMIIIGHSFDKHNKVQFEVRWEAEGEDAEDFWFSRSELFAHHKEAVLDYEDRCGIGHDIR